MSSVWRRCAIVLVAVTTLGLPVPDGAEAQQSLLTEELIKMLEAELSEQIILEWLETTETPLAPLSADDLVALKKAGASEELMRHLLDRPREEPPDSAAVSAPAREADSGSTALTTVVLAYLARVEDPDREWDLYVYIDGVPVSYVTTGEVEIRPNRVEFARQVPAGRHVVRVTQERHIKRRGRWEHWTRVAGEEFGFDLAAGIPARIELEFRERLMDFQDPLVFKLTQGDSIVDSGRVGGEAEFWPLLCEDVEASIAEGKKPGRRQQRELEECVRWESLWREADAPSRQEVLEAMSQFDYRPLPKGS